MKYQQSLQVRLQERYRRLAKTDYDVYAREMAYFVNFVLATPPLKAIVDHIERSLPELHPEEWVASKFGWHGYDWPDSELGRAKVVWWFLRRIADGKDPLEVAHSFGREGNLTEILGAMTEAAIEPFVEYLQALLGTESDVLYLLDRYRRRVEWFEQSRLYAECSADPSKCEAVYDSDLRRFLFEQGVDYPFSQPASASGKADVVSGLESDDPLVCDVKLFDGDSRGVAYLSAATTQVLQYAMDYGKTAAHLVIANLTDVDLELPSDGVPGEWPPRLEVAGVTVFLVSFRAKPRVSASKQGRARPLRITRGELVE